MPWYLLAEADLVSWEKIGLVGTLGLLLVAMTFWVRDQIKTYQTVNREEKTALVKDLKETNAMLLKAHTDARDLVTGALVKSAEADTKMAASLDKLANNQQDFTETLRNVRCLHESGAHMTVNVRQPLQQ